MFCEIQKKILWLEGHHVCVQRLGYSNERLVGEAWHRGKAVGGEWSTERIE